MVRTAVGFIFFLYFSYMKKLFFLLLLTACCAGAANAQDAKAKGKNDPAKDTMQPYRKNPTLPAFNLRLMDSVTIFNTYNIPGGKPIGLFFFDPECSHCQAVIKALLKGMDSIKEIQFYMITPVHSATALRKFYADYHLGDYKNIVLAGRDYEFFFGSFYGVKYVPDLALYDGNKKLVKLYEGAITVKELHKAIH